MSGHPMERCADEAARLSSTNTETISKHKNGDKVTMAGMVMDYREKTTKTGKRLGLFALEDLKGRTEVVVYSEALGRLSEVLRTQDPVLLSGSVRIDQRGEDESRNLILSEATLLQDVRSKKTKQVHVHLDAATFDAEEMPKLKTLLEQHPGRCDAFIEIVIPNRSITTIVLSEQYRVAPSDDLLRSMDGLTGVQRVEFC